MSVDLHGGLRFWVFLIVLVTLFSAAFFRPERIRQRARFWNAAGLLAFMLFLECVAPLFFSPALGTIGGAIKLDSLTAGMQDYLNAVKVIGVLQHAALAAAVLIALSAFFDGAEVSGKPPRRPEAVARPQSEEVQESPPRVRMAEVSGNPPRRPEAVARPRSEEVQQSPRVRMAEDACMSCGQRIPLEASKCPACGWSWGNEEAKSS